MKRSQCKIAIELYQDFPNVMSKVDEFLTVAEVIFFPKFSKIA